MTPIELRKAALYELRVTAAGDPVAPEDDELLRDKYRTLHAMLLREKLATWGAVDDIPAWAEQPLVSMLAFLSAPAFGIEAGRMRDLAAQGSLNGPVQSQAERMLRRYIARTFIYTTARTTYY